MQDATKKLVIDAHQKLSAAITAVMNASDAAREDFAQQPSDSPTRDTDYMAWQLIMVVENRIRNTGKFSLGHELYAAAVYAGYEER